MMRLSRHVIVFVLVAAGLAAEAPSAPAATNCSADVRARLAREEIREEVKETTFAVEIDTQATCAKVYVDFTSTERLFDGEEITTTRRGWRKVAGPSTYKVDYPIARDSDLVDWKFSVSRCVPCGTE
jgi:hypothetical protein